MELTAEQGRNIVYGDDENWDEVKGTREIIDQGRWTVYYAAVFHHKPSGKHYSMSWGRGATESQEESPFEYDQPDPVEVELREVVEKKWVPAEVKA